MIVLEFGAHLFVTAFLGFVGWTVSGFADAGASRLLTSAVWLLLPVLVGFTAGLLDFGLYPRTARWVWVPLTIPFGVFAYGNRAYASFEVWLSGGSFCYDLRCLGMDLFLFPALAAISYSAAAAVGARRYRRAIQLPPDEPNGE